MVLYVELLSGRFRERVKRGLKKGRKICIKSINKAKEVITHIPTSVVTSAPSMETVNGAMRKMSTLLLALAGVYMLYQFYLMIKAAKKRFIQVGTVGAIMCYPVASCQGISFGTAECATNGITVQHVVDRDYCIGVKDKKKIHLFKSPLLKNVKVLSDQRNLVLQTPKNKPFRFPLDQSKSGINVTTSGTLAWHDTQMPVTDCGDQVSKYLGTAFKTDKRVGLYTFNKAHSGSGKKSGYVFVPTSSIEVANSTFHFDPPLSSEYFRPNIVITKSPALDEENWDTIRIGEEVLFKVEKSHSCLIEENWSAKEKEWKHEVEQYKAVPKVTFLPGSCSMVNVGVVATLVHGGEIHVGDDVYVQYK